MAQINLKIKSDFAQASRDLKKFGTITESERKRIEKYQKSFKDESIDKFIDKNRRLGAGIQANKGTISAIITQQKKLERQSISLIQKGLDPQSDEVQKLNDEYNRLQREYEQTTKKQKNLESGMRMATNVAKTAGVAIIALGTATVTALNKFAQMGDQLAKDSKKIGLSVESLQELQFAAERSGLQSGKLSGIFEKLNRNVGDLQSGTGTLTTFLNKSDTALKDQLLSAESSEEAFNLLVSAVEKAPTEFEKAALAQAAFGRSGQDLIVLASEGAEGIKALREEAREYGLVSEESAKMSEGFADAQRDLQQSFTGLGSEIAEVLLPGATSAIRKFSELTVNLRDYIKSRRELNEAEKAQKEGLSTKEQEILLLEDQLKKNNELLKGLKNLQKNEATRSVRQAQQIAQIESQNSAISNGIMLKGLEIKADNDKKKAIKETAKEEQKAQQVNKDTLKLIDTIIEADKERLEIIDQEISDIQKFTAIDEESKQKQLEAIRLLEEEKKQIRDNEVAEVEDKNAKELKSIQDKYDAEFEAFLKKNKKIDKAEDNAKKESEKREAEKQEQLVDNVDKYVAYAKKGFRLINAIATEEYGELVSIAGSALTEIGRQTGDTTLQVAGALTSITGEIISAFEDSAEKIEQLEDQLAQSVNAIVLNNEKAQIEQKRDLRLDALKEQQQDEINSFLATLSIEEQNRLKADGIIEENNSERLAREIKETQKAGDIETAEYLKQQKEIADIKQSVSDEKKRIEIETANSIAQINHEIAVAEIKTQIELLRAQRSKDTSELWWNPDQQKRVKKSYNEAIDSLKGITIPSPVLQTAQTGTPMGGFQVPENMSTTRADSVNLGNGMAVSGGETVTVTPRGESSGQSMNISVNIGEEALVNIINQKIESQDIVIRTENIQGGGGAVA